MLSETLLYISYNLTVTWSGSWNTWKIEQRFRE